MERGCDFPLAVWVFLTVPGGTLLDRWRRVGLGPRSHRWEGSGRVLSWNCASLVTGQSQGCVDYLCEQDVLGNPEV